MDRLNELYFKDVDHIVNRANQLGLVVGMLPDLGRQVDQKWGAGPEIFTRKPRSNSARPSGDDIAMPT